MSLFTTDWLRAADDDTRRPIHDYGLRYGREARARHDREQIGGYRGVMPHCRPSKHAARPDRRLIGAT